MKQISCRLGDDEFARLKRFCEFSERNQNDVVREAIRRFLEAEKAD